MAQGKLAIHRRNGLPQAVVKLLSFEAVKQKQAVIGMV